MFRNAVRSDHPGVKDGYAAVAAAARRLCELVAEVCMELDWKKEGKGGELENGGGGCRHV